VQDLQLWPDRIKKPSFNLVFSVFRHLKRKYPGHCWDPYGVFLGDEGFDEGFDTRGVFPCLRVGLAGAERLVSL
jgi:hypothetical protein